eukprot:447334_1
MDLYKTIKSLQVLNIDESESTISATELSVYESIKDSKSFIVSDVDEELIILIQFFQPIDLKSIKLYAHDIEIDDASPPKQIHIYKINNLNYDFDDIKSLKSVKSIKCSSKKLSKGQSINVNKNIKNPLTFKKVSYLAIYIESNQNDTEKTYLNGMVLKGQFDANELQKQSNSNKITLTEIKDPNSNTAYDQLNNLSVKELTQYLHSKNIDPKAAPYNCIEKTDLVKLALKTHKQFKQKDTNNIDTEHKNDDQ